MRPGLEPVLCTQCGLCCDGSLFADVELVGQAEAMRLEIMGLEVEEDGTVPGLLSQPCAALREKRCGIYVYRPTCCRTFECQLLQDAQRGAVTVERATAQIVEALKRIRRVRELLVQMGHRGVHLPLRERCAEALAGEASASGEANRKRAELKTAMSAAESLLWRKFLGSGGRRRGPDRR